MKKKKCTAVILAAILALSCCSPAFAEDFLAQAETSSAEAFTDSSESGEISEETVSESVPADTSEETGTQDSSALAEGAVVDDSTVVSDSADPAASDSADAAISDSIDAAVDDSANTAAADSADASASDSADAAVSDSTDAAAGPSADAAISDSTDAAMDDTAGGSLSEASTEIASADAQEELIIDASEPTPTPEATQTPAASETESAFVSLNTDEVSSSGTATLTCEGKSTGVIRITAKVTQKIKSKDNYYYLYRVNPSTGALTRQIAKKKKPSGKNKTVTFKLNTSGHPEYIQGKYVLAVKTKSGSFQAVSSASYVKNPEKTAEYKAAYELPSTKKGIQTTDYSQITSTKSKTVFFNLAVSTVLADNGETVSYKYNGKTYYFNAIGGYTYLVSQCNQKGIAVTMQLNLDWTSVTSDLAYASSKSSAPYYAWDSLSTAPRLKMEALFSFLAELFGSDDCYVSNWILGNEVNSSTLYNYAGNNISEADYVEIYSEAFRCLYNAVRGVRASSKCFICLDHCWNTTAQGFAGKSILNSFNAKLKELQANVNWNLAYHAYPFPLTDCRFYLNKYPTQTTSSSTSPIITLNNLSVLTNYIKQNFGSNTRIILSEQGFTSTQGEDAQAAAIALAYYIAACNPMIDAFIIRSYEDQSGEVAQGLAMGIKGKKAFNVFKYMDSSKTLSYTSSYLTSQVGSSWTSMVPNYKVKRLYKLYRSK